MRKLLSIFLFWWFFLMERPFWTFQTESIDEWLTRYPLQHLETWLNNGSYALYFSFWMVDLLAWEIRGEHCPTKHAKISLIKNILKWWQNYNNEFDYKKMLKTLLKCSLHEWILLLMVRFGSYFAWKDIHMSLKALTIWDLNLIC